MGRLSVVFGASRDRTQDMIELQVGEWLEALQGVWPSDLEAGVSLAVKECKFWPVASEILALAKRAAATKAANNGVEHGDLHSERIKGIPPGLTQSPLRSNPTWRKFMDAIHPMHEHYFFARAEFGEFANIIRDLTKFEVETLWAKFGRRLSDMFGGSVKLIPSLDLTEKPERRQDDEPLSLNEVERRTQVARDLKVKWGYNPSPAT